MRNLIAGLLTLLVVACATPTSPEKQVYAMQRSLDVYLEEVEAYAAQPVCTEELVVACYEPEVLRELYDAGEKADMHLDRAEAAVRSGEGAVQSSIAAARAALRVLSLKLAEEG